MALGDNGLGYQLQKIELEKELLCRTTRSGIFTI